MRWPRRNAPVVRHYARVVTAQLWIKQYGLERSGTNFAKALVEMTSPDVRVLATVLGSKHARPDLDRQVALLEEGDVGIAVTDLGPTDFRSIVDAYRSRHMGVMLCVRDVITWIDAYERHMARREKRQAEVLSRERLGQLTEKWLTWVYEMSDWSESTGLRSIWAVHHEVVRHPQRFLDRVTEWGGTPGVVLPINYLKKAGDFHGSHNVTQRPYRTRQYRDAYSGAGQIHAEDVDWVCALVAREDVRGLATRFMWDRRPLRRRRDSR